MIARAHTGTSFGGLKRYLIDEEEERVSRVTEQHILRKDADWAVTQMRDTASQSSRIEAPVYHISVSFPEADETTHRERLSAMQTILSELGLEEHEALFVEHDDTGHDHLHAMVNRVHPREGTAWSPDNDWEKIEQVERRIEEQMGWERVAGFHARPEDAKAPTPALSDREAQKKKQGEVPFTEQVERLAREDFEEARTWMGLEQGLREKGLALNVDDRGGTVTNGERSTPLSAVDRQFSGPRLAERFGESYRAYEKRHKTDWNEKAWPGSAEGTTWGPDKSEEDFSLDIILEEDRDPSQMRTPVQKVLMQVTEAEAARWRGESREAAFRSEEVALHWENLELDERSDLREALHRGGNAILDDAVSHPSVESSRVGGAQSMEEPRSTEESRSIVEEDPRTDMNRSQRRRLALLRWLSRRDLEESTKESDRFQDILESYFGELEGNQLEEFKEHLTEEERRVLGKAQQQIRQHTRQHVHTLSR